MAILEQERMIPVGPTDEIYLKEKWREDTAAGPAVLMIHGYNALASLCNYDIPVEDYSGMDFLASRGYDVFALDMRGFGRSSHPESVAMEDNISDVGAAADFILAERGVGHLSLVGGSYGGPITYTYASRYPGKIERMVLMGTPYRTGKPALRDMLDAVISNADQQQSAYISLPASERPGEEAFEMDMAVAAWRFEASKNADNRVPAGPIRHMRTFAAADAVPSVVAPTLLVLGDSDFGMSVEDNLALLADLGSREKALVVIGNAGHGLMYETKHLYVWSIVCEGLPPTDVPMGSGRP